MEKKDLVIALFGASVGLGGILLVFVGFIYAHSEGMDLELERKKYKTVAKVGMLPFLVSLVCAFLCLRWMLCPSPEAMLPVYSFYLSLGLTALYGLVAFLFYL
jgi:hypothetical protein